jgi:tRNA nucleotidyltransferase (CCA-adding enzyme)
MQFLENLPFDLDLLPKPGYLVGGAVRDGLMGRVRAELDLDLVIPTGAVAVARQLAAEYRAGFVLLDAERQIARVVFPQMTVDIAQQDGESIIRDLARRDYTLNAIAYDLQTKTIIDPHGGTQDIQQQTIRMISKDNLIDDPLRLLRAYRQGAQLDFTIESATRQAIRDLAHLTTAVAAERVLAELRYLLKTTHSSQWLAAVVADDVLTGWLVEPVRADLADRLAQIDRSIATIQVEYPALDRHLHQPLRETIAISRAEIGKFMAILSPDLQIATAQMLRLTFSSVEIQVVTTAINNLPQLLRGEMSLPEQYFWFQAVGDNFPVLVILAIAAGLKIDSLRDLICRYLDLLDQVAHPTPLVSGHDLMQALQLKPSPQIGKLLVEIQLARIQGEIVTPADAIELARRLEKFRQN